MEAFREPLVIQQPGNKYGEYFNLNGAYLFTVQEFHAKSQFVVHSMIAPGFFSERAGILTEVYRPDVRPLHRHDALELIYVIQGELTQFIEDYYCTYTEGECCILNKNIRHVESFSSNFKAVFILLSDSFLHGIMESDIYFSGSFSWQPNTNSVYQHLHRLLQDRSRFRKEMLDFIPVGSARELREEVEALFNRMIRETKSQDPGYFSVVSGCFARLLSLLAAKDSYRISQVDLRNSNEDFIFNQISIFLRQNHGRVDYEELEKILHYTRDYLNRVIKRRSGITLTEFGRSICLEEAADMLQNSRKSIGAIMQELGYSNRTYFYRIFKERFGMTPQAYRKDRLCRETQGPAAQKI